MALRWHWSEKIGYLMVTNHNKDSEVQNFKVDLYIGNAYLIMIYEWKEGDKDRYNLQGFFADKKHAQICLGIQKSSDGTKDNMYDGWIESVNIYDDVKQASDIFSTFAKAKWSNGLSMNLIKREEVTE